MIITSKLKMDLERAGVTPVIHAVQDDSYSRDLEITLLAGGLPCVIPGTATALVRYRKADGTGGEYDTMPDGTAAWVVSRNMLTVRLAPQVLTAPGTVTVTVTVFTGEKQISLFPITVKVEKAACGDLMESENYYYVTGFLPAPTEASVGDYIRVSAVDDCGKVLAVEAVGLSGASGDADDSSVPNYWLAALQAGAEAINTALCSAGCKKSAFLFYSDAHWNYGSKMSPKLLKYLYRHTGITKTIFGGDIVNNEGSDYDTMAYLWNWRNQLKDLPNHHSVVGNHDDGNATNNLFSEEYIYGYLLAAEETPDIVREDSGIYYYIDCPAEKTRYLYLDTAYKGAVTAQQTFVKNALLTTPAGWHIVAAAHIWHDTDYSVSPPVPAGINADAQIFLTMFDDYNARSGDYAACGGRVEFCVGGHAHWDYDSRTDGGIPILLVEADGWAVRSGLSFAAGTTGEASVSGIIADYESGTIHVVRIGRGTSRTVSLTGTGSGGSGDDSGGDSGDDSGDDSGGNSGGDSGGDSGESTSYTNLLLTAVDSDGSLCPWEENIRWSGTSGGEVEDAGTYLSGHIPYTPGQTVYLKNVTLLNESGSGVIHYFSDLGVRIDGTHINDVVTYWNGVVNSSNMVTQFTMFVNDAYADVKYLRIECTGFDSTSVVTVDEPIE